MPTITSLSPTSGPASGGNRVVITGTRFGPGPLTVRFGSVPTTFTVTSDTRIRATVPAGTGVRAVTVTTPGGTSNGVSYTYTHT
ncbi:IPT/TIG domain-containing protein [Nocardia amamiensis]|uniref:IPT/TIG domain-containing protein n=1 Tax=Nocardia TaxID=1817 RepID=UPI0033D84C2F